MVFCVLFPYFCLLVSFVSLTLRDIVSVWYLTSFPDFLLSSWRTFCAHADPCTQNTIVS
jgi:hypothetical protein